MEITREEFEKIYNEKTFTAAGKILGVTEDAIKSVGLMRPFKLKGELR